MANSCALTAVQGGTSDTEMGCASSGVLTRGGSFIKEAADDAVEKGGHVMHDVGETLKEEFNDGYDQVKTTVSSMLSSAEDGLEKTAEKISNVFTHKVEPPEPEITAKDAINSFSEAVAEEMSETETMPASEMDEPEKMDLTPKIDTLMMEVESEPVKMVEVELEPVKMVEAEPEPVKMEPVEEMVEVEVSEGVRPPTPVPIVPDLQEADSTVVETEATEATDAEVPEMDDPTPATPEENPTQWELEADAILNRPVKVPPKRPMDLEHDIGSSSSKWVRRSEHDKEKDDGSTADELECLRNLLEAEAEAAAAAATPGDTGAASDASPAATAEQVN